MTTTEQLEEKIVQLEKELDYTRKIKDKLNNFFETLNNINEFLGRMVAMPSIEAIAKEGLQFLRGIIEYEQALFLRYNPSENNYESVYLSEITCKDCSPYTHLMGPDIIDWVSQRKVPMLFPTSEDFFVSDSVKSVVYLPLVSSFTPIGMFVLCSPGSDEDFNLENNHLLQSIVFQISVAMENFQLIESISEIKDFMKDVMENMINGVITVGLDKKLTYINRNAQFMLNLQVTDVIHRSYLETFPASLAKICDEVINQTLEAGNVIDYEYEQKLSETTVLPIGISASLLMSRDFSATGYVLIFRDLSLTREIMKLKELDEMKNDFIAKVSHELRTPLTSISSYTDALLDGMADSKEEVDSYLRIIQEESNRLISMVNDILDLSKMEAGKMFFTFSELRLNSLINTCINSIMPAAKKKNVKLVHKETCDLMVKADMDKIIQVFINLVGNAVKFTPEEGNIEISVTDKKTKAQIAIKDTGIGMEKEDLERIFDKFYQIENVKHHQKGTGLGMTICREIITNHAGKIWVVSEKGKGTTVFFTLPVVQEEKHV